MVISESISLFDLGYGSGVGADPSSSYSSSLTGSVMMVDALSESQTRMIRGLLACLTRLVALQFKNVQEPSWRWSMPFVKQTPSLWLLPEWSRTSLTSFSYPFTILVETAAVTPEMLRHVLVLTYYACLARTVIARSYNTTQVPHLAHQDIFGDVRMSVVRHSPVFEHTATIAFEIFGEARIENLMYAFTLPFLRRAAILCRSVLPSSFPTPIFDSDVCECTRLLAMLDIPPLSDSDLSSLQNALSKWCAHYGRTVTY